MNNVESTQLRQVQSALERERRTNVALQSEIKTLRASLKSAPAQAQSVGGENWSAETLRLVGNILQNKGTVEAIPALAERVMAELKGFRAK